MKTMLSHSRWLKVFMIATGCTCLSSAYSSPLPSELVTTQTIEEIAEQAAKDAVKAMLKKIKKAEKAHTQNPQKTSSTDNTVAGNQLFSIGSGVVGGNYFVLGELIGGVISHPQGSLGCDEGGTCGVPNLQSVNITSAGSLANVRAIRDGGLQSGFAQSNVAYAAYTGTGLFDAGTKIDDLRAIASLYPEAVHIVINKSANITSIADLKGKRVSVGAKDSGTLMQARMVLASKGLSEDDLEVEHLNNQQSIEKMQAGGLDAMFFSVGAPAPSLVKLFSDNTDFSLLSLGKGLQQDILKKGAYFSPYTIAENTYPNVGTIETISVFALWLTSAHQDKDLIYTMTKALWNDKSRQLFDSSDIGRQVRLKKSLKGIGIPLHDGAKKYYDEIGKRF